MNNGVMNNGVMNNCVMKSISDESTLKKEFED